MTQLTPSEQAVVAGAGLFLAVRLGFRLVKFAVIGAGVLIAIRVLSPPSRGE